MLTGKRGKGRTARRVEHLPMVGVCIGGSRGGVRHALGEQGRILQSEQLLAPKGFVRHRVLPLQPANVIGKTALMVRHLDPGITLQHLAQQQGIAPAIEQHVVMGVNQLLTLLVEAHQRQTQQRRLGRIELQAFAAGQQLQLRVLIVTAAPVEHGERQLQCALHHLHRFCGALRPVEPAAQNRVRIQCRLPRLPQSRRVQPFGFDAELVDVSPGLRFVEAVKQQPALHWRQRVQVFDLPRSHRQFIQLALAQWRQREVCRGHTAVLRVDAVRHQRPQVGFDGRRQCLNISLVEALLTEAQVQFQFTAKHLTVH